MYFTLATLCSLEGQPISYFTELNPLVYRSLLALFNDYCFELSCLSHNVNYCGGSLVLKTYWSSFSNQISGSGKLFWSVSLSLLYTSSQQYFSYLKVHKGKSCVGMPREQVCVKVLCVTATAWNEFHKANIELK